MRRITRSTIGTVMVAALVLASCGDDTGDDAVGTPDIELTGKPVESGLPGDAKPVRGGQLVYGVDANNTNFCLPEAQMAISGIQISRAIYDPLVVPNGDDGGYSPYLAESVEPNDDYTAWTIKLRDGVVFHDGTELDATVVKNNLDAYRGAPGSPRASLLLAFAYADIADVTVVNELTVEVTTKVPWVAFPASLYNSGRVLMLAQAQLEADKESCQTEPIGTGPFSLASWEEGRSMKLQRNDKYWYDAPDGKPYPYVNAIDFRAMPNDDARLAALQRGDINMMHSSSSADIVKNLAELRNDGAINLVVSQSRTEMVYFMLNTRSEPFDTQDGRVATAQAIDREKINELANRSFPEIANGPFARDVPGHLDDNGFPEFDLEAAKAKVEELKAAGKSTEFRVLSSNNPSTIRSSVIAKEMLEEAGFTVNLEVEEQVDLITRMIARDFDMLFLRNQPGDDPDANRIWWYGEGNIVNFGGFDDEVINENLTIGRSESDPDVRRKAYEAVNRRMAEQAYNVYLYYQPWAVAMAPNVHGVFGPTLPDGKEPSDRLSSGHSLLGVWIEQGSLGTDS